MQPLRFYLRLVLRGRKSAFASERLQEPSQYIQLATRGVGSCIEPNIRQNGFHGTKLTQ